MSAESSRARSPRLGSTQADWEAEDMSLDGLIAHLADRNVRVHRPSLAVALYPSSETRWTSSRPRSVSVLQQNDLILQFGKFVVP